MIMIWWYWRNCKGDIWTRPDVSKTTRKAQSPFRLNSHSGEKHCLNVLLPSWWSLQIMFCEVEVLWKPLQQTCQRPGLHRAWVGTWCLGRAPMCPSRTWEVSLTISGNSRLTIPSTCCCVVPLWTKAHLRSLNILCLKLSSQPILWV